MAKPKEQKVYNQQQQFLRTAYPIIIQQLDDLGIDRVYADSIAAQMMYEGGWGQRPSGKNNYFGMKATKDQKGTIVTTKEKVNGKYTTIKDKFLDFDSLEDGIKSGIIRLRDKFNAFDVDPKYYSKNLKNKGYYTEDYDQYNKTINGIINGRTFKGALDGLEIQEKQNKQTIFPKIPTIYTYKSTPDKKSVLSDTSNKIKSNIKHAEDIISTQEPTINKNSNESIFGKYGTLVSNLSNRIKENAAKAPKRNVLDIFKSTFQDRIPPGYRPGQYGGGTFGGHGAGGSW